MATIDIFTNKQHTLLTELESIKSLLDNDNKQVDNIPLLQYPVSSPSLPHEAERTRADLTATVTNKGNNNQNVNTEFANVNHDAVTTNVTAVLADISSMQSSLNGTNALPGQRSLFTNAKAKISTHKISEPQLVDNSADQKASSLAENPFLPAHLRQRLNNQHAAESSDQDDILNNMDEPADEQRLPTANASYTQRLIDQLVSHHLPKIEAELRRKLVEVVKNHNDQLQQ
jgi:hypothetical protein